ncbi:hypothetical protein LL037_24045 [Clostridium estertheticum]|uniref:hypothetical protein n=1 Tax=Clostridium estertheticum TaxID=238834 RepID=UPI001C0BE1CB|nr:hypothetical protein [Clostridium estertheticum]MBU3199453.1 hypothetical protein [Clostridium estertheticum]WAG65468.1 hypothetical protein LL037_24045 [Clostridium estertheticum]
MESKINKKTIGIVAVIVIILAISGIFYMKSKSSKVDPSAPITATVRKASFGCVVNVTLSDAGKKQYKDVTKYQIYYNGKAINQITVIGKATTAFPIRKENDKVVVKLLKSDKVAYSVDLELKKGEAVK